MGRIHCPEPLRLCSDLAEESGLTSKLKCDIEGIGKTIKASTHSRARNPTCPVLVIIARLSLPTMSPSIFRRHGPTRVSKVASVPARAG